MPKRSVYLHDIPMDEAWAAFTATLAEAGLWQPLSGEDVPLSEALWRVTAAPVWAAVSAPHYHASAMDGYAVRARDTEGASEANPLALRLIDDDADAERVERPAREVNTGHALPPWANAVIMVEHVQPAQEEHALLIRAPVAPWQHVRQMGEDMVATELVLPANHRLRPVDLGALAGSGHATVSVRRRPSVAIIPTGSELVAVDDVGAGQRPAPGHIIEFNSLVLAAQVAQWGGVATRWPIIPDDYESLRAAVAEAAQTHDLVLVNAGSSAGSEDYTVHVLRDLGEVLVHGIAIRPGHPVIFGMVTVPPIPGPSPTKGWGREDSRTPDAGLRGQGGEAVPIIGVPGYPVSTALTGEVFVEPLISRWLGLPPAEPLTMQATISRKVMSPTGDDDYLRVTVGQVGERVIATPLARGAGVISSLVRADGIVRIPRFSEGLDAGAEVNVHLYRTPAQIARTVVAIGSHDMTLDLLAQFLAERAPGYRLASANVGSLGGLVALRRGEAHLAGSHLLDPDTGDYNWRYIDQYLPGRDVTLITLVRREQGLIVPPGNPQRIESLDDLAREDVTFVNRQRGAGTRLLLDYELEQRGIDPARVRGYDREEYTHLAVAAAVASGSASCGMGVRAAARALELDFLTVGWERYDLVIPREHAESDLLAPLLALLHDDAFRAAVAAMPGYDVEPMGQVVARE